MTAAEPVSPAAGSEGKAARAAEVQAHAGVGAGVKPEAGGESETPAKSGGGSRRGGRRRGKGRAAAEGTTGGGEDALVEETLVAAEPAAVGALEGEPQSASEARSGGGDADPRRHAGKAPPPRGARRAQGARAQRRGRSGSAGRGRSPDPPAASKPAAGKRAAKPAVKPAAERADSKSRRRERDHRRPKAIVRQDEGSGLGTTMTAPSPRSLGVTASKIKRRIILVTDDGQELRVALVEDGRLAEIYIERPDKKSYLGDIYQGKVENVMSGIDAAFVDFGLEKNGFLYVDEVTRPEGEKRARRIGDALKNGQQVLVQVTKDPMGNKGARLSTKISLAGRYLVYVPGGSGVGVSRRLRRSERDRLRDSAKELKAQERRHHRAHHRRGPGPGRAQARPALPLAPLVAPQEEGRDGQGAGARAQGGRHLHRGCARPLQRHLREPHRRRPQAPQGASSPFSRRKRRSCCPRCTVTTARSPCSRPTASRSRSPRPWSAACPLPSGGNLVIDHAEALTVIDVNTGRFTRGKGLEDTITKTNLEAAREVVRQLRLRDIGGIIIIDFIDMAHAKNREMVLATLEAELETDRTKTYVVELSPLGLVEMTRQNTTDGARGILTRTCPACLGKARVMSDETMALNVERRVRALARKSAAKAWLIEVNGAVAERLSGDRLKRLEKEIGRRVFFEGGAGLPGRDLPRAERRRAGARHGAAPAAARGPGGRGRAGVQPHVQSARRRRVRRRLHGHRGGRSSVSRRAPQSTRHDLRLAQAREPRCSRRGRIDRPSPIGYHRLPLSCRELK